MIFPLLSIVCVANFSRVGTSGFSKDHEGYSSLSPSESCSSYGHSGVWPLQPLDVFERKAEDDEEWGSDRFLRPLVQYDPLEPLTLASPHVVWKDLRRIVRSGVLRRRPFLSTDGRNPLLQTIGLHLPFFSPYLDGITIMTASLDNFLAVLRAYREILPDDDDIVFYPSWFRYGGQAFIYEFLERDRNWPLGALQLLPRQFWQGMGSLEPAEQEKLCKIIPSGIMDLIPKRMRRHVPSHCVQAVDARRRVRGRRVSGHGTFD